MVIHSRIETLIIIVICFIQVGCTTASIKEDKKIDENKTIEVIGSSEMLIQPDQILLNINLNLPNKSKKEEEFINTLKKHGVTEDKISLKGIDNYNWNYYYYNRRQGLNYSILVDSSVNSKNLMNDLKQTWVTNIRIAQTQHTKIEALLKKIKIAAIKAAKEKATYLLEALDEELGSVVSITEIPPTQDDNTNSYFSYWGRQQTNDYLYSNSTLNSGENEVSNISKEKLRYEIKVIFKIK